MTQYKIFKAVYQNIFIFKLIKLIILNSSDNNFSSHQTLTRLLLKTYGNKGYDTSKTEDFTRKRR